MGIRGLSTLEGAPAGSLEQSNTLCLGIGERHEANRAQDPESYPFIRANVILAKELLHTQNKFFLDRFFVQLSLNPSKASEPQLTGRLFFWRPSSGATRTWLQEALPGPNGISIGGESFLLDINKTISQLGSPENLSPGAWMDLIPSAKKAGLDGKTPTWLIWEDARLPEGNIARYQSLVKLKPDVENCFVPFERYPSNPEAVLRSRLPGSEKYVLQLPNTHMMNPGTDGLAHLVQSISLPTSKHVSADVAVKPVVGKNGLGFHASPQSLTLNLQGDGTQKVPVSLSAYRIGNGNIAPINIFSDEILPGSITKYDLSSLEKSDPRDWTLPENARYVLSLILTIGDQSFVIATFTQGPSFIPTKGLIFPF